MRGSTVFRCSSFVLRMLWDTLSISDLALSWGKHRTYGDQTSRRTRGTPLKEVFDPIIFQTSSAKTSPSQNKIIDMEYIVNLPFFQWNIIYDPVVDTADTAWRRWLECFYFNVFQEKVIYILSVAVYFTMTRLSK